MRMDVDKHPSTEEKQEFRLFICNLCAALALLAVMFYDHGWWFFGPFVLLDLYQGGKAWGNWRAERKERLERQAAFQTWRERISSVPPPP